MDTIDFDFGPARLAVPTTVVLQKMLEKAERKTIEAPAIHIARAVPRLGDFWPEQAGIRYGEMRGENGEPDYDLILPTDQRAIFKKVAWGVSGKAVPGADSDRDGMANTIAMAEADSELAQKILDIKIGGHKDFFLMARHHARLGYLNVPELIGPEPCWTSTQYSADNAWCQGFDDGHQYTNGKDGELSAFAVRRVLIIR